MRRVAIIAMLLGRIVVISFIFRVVSIRASRVLIRVAIRVVMCVVLRVVIHS